MFDPAPAVRDRGTGRPTKRDRRAVDRLIKLKGVSRFHLQSIEPEVKLYLSPINFDPRRLPPGFRISTPADWAPELAEQVGPYKTIGWQIDTWAISEGFASEKIFWDDMEWTVTQSRKMFHAMLERDDDLITQVFDHLPVP